MRNPVLFPVFLLALLVLWVTPGPVSGTGTRDTLHVAGHFQYPESHDVTHLAVDPAGRIYLAMRGRNNIFVYNQFGTHLDTLALPGREGYFAKEGAFIVDDQGALILCDAALGVVQKMTLDGKLLFALTERGTDKGAFHLPVALAVDENRQLYVADLGNRRIQIFNPEGVYLGGIFSGETSPAHTGEYRLLQREEFTGKPIPKTPVLRAPVLVRVDGEGFRYVLDQLPSFIFIYNAQGQYMGNIDLKTACSQPDLEPVDFIVHASGKIVLLDRKDQNLKILDRQGRYLSEWGSRGTAPGQFFKPRALALGKDQLVVLDQGNNRIQILNFGPVRSPEDGGPLRIPEYRAPRVLLFPIHELNQNAGDLSLGLAMQSILRDALKHSTVWELVDEKTLQDAMAAMQIESLTALPDEKRDQLGKNLNASLAVTGAIALEEGIWDIQLRLVPLPAGREVTAIQRRIPAEGSLSVPLSDLALQLQRNFVNQIGAPGRPRGLFALPSTQSILIRWERSPEETIAGYNVFRGVTSEGPFVKIATVRDHEYTDQKIQDHAEHHYRVTAFNTEGKESIPSLSVKTQLRKLPDFGYLLDVTSRPLPKRIVFTWSNPEPEAVHAYEVYRADRRDGEFRLVGTTSKKRFEETGLDDGKTYFYRVRKVYENGLVSEFSNAFSCSTDSRPIPITELEAVSGLTEQVRVHWRPREEDKDIRTYVIARSEFPDGAFVPIARVGARRFEYTDRRLHSNTTYYYKIKAVDHFGLESDFSRDVVATTRPVPPAPRRVAAGSGLAGRVALEWEGAGAIDGVSYKIYRAETFDGKYKEIATLTGTQYMDSRLPNSQQFFYFVTTRDGDGLVSPPSDIVSARTKSIPSIPTNLKALGRQPRKVTLVWDRNPEPDIHFYRIFAATRHQGPFRKIGETQELHFIYVGRGRGLNDNSPYFFQIRAVDQDGLISLNSATAQATTKALPPSPPEPVIVFKDGQVVLSWQGVPGEDVFGYTVYKNRRKITVVKSNMHVDGNVLPGKRYRYAVATVDKDQLESPQSVQVTIRIPEIVPQ